MHSPDNLLSFILLAAKLCTLIFCWSLTVILGALGAVLFYSESGRNPRAFVKTIDYTAVSAIIFGAGAIVLGVVGWLGSVLLVAVERGVR